MKPLHLLFICNELPPASSGGIGIFVDQVCRRLVKMGRQATVIGLYDQTGFEESTSYKVIRLKRLKGLGILGQLPNSLRLQLFLKNYLKKSYPAVSLIEYPDYEGLAAFHFQDVPFVVRTHDSGFYAQGKHFGKRGLNPAVRLRWTLHKTGICRAKGVVYVSKANQNGVEAYVKNPNARLVYNFPEIQLAPDNGLLSERLKKRPFLLNFGSVNRQKGCITLLEAFARLVEEDGLEADLVFVGRKNDADVEVFFQRQSENIRQRIHFEGAKQKDELAAYIHLARFVVFPSQNENMPLSWLEAMSLGKVIIVSDIPVAQEMIEDQQNGFIAGHTASDFFETIKTAWSLDSALLKKIEQAAAETIRKKFNPEILMEQNIAFWQEIASVR